MSAPTSAMTFRWNDQVFTIEMPETRAKALADVETERARQDAYWGGPVHDDNHSATEWCLILNARLGKASEAAIDRDFPEARRRLIQIAAVAVAAVESLDRLSEEGGLR